MRRRTKLIAATVLLAAFAVAAILLPVPAPAELRAWADDAGAVTPLVFLAAYTLLTVLPIPRTVFSLAAGLLLGEALGIVVAMTATTISAGLGFALARGLGREPLSRLLHRGAVRTVNERLSDGGVLAVTSLRLIPVIPFAPLSYCCGLADLRVPAYLAGTALGSLPGTAAVVLAGDALTGTTPPALLLCYGLFALLGGAGLVRVLRRAPASAGADAAVSGAKPAPGTIG
ncbi:hypothetical protein CFN78_21535 [Amycolatopsis antarctica]|uniref:TVP38/TMEM64 family membrane protein n=1 Tax=Amycolatopsis antarctica TaxID=1854586 RepID=A0A263D1F9_9PSEU|nr:TVP38/TMEM64 family protein [Amycolatopsis antarctica]OZM71175.1 hypothetical protein CFN78_21535 [Amycolatopsis antarctica]